jgi:two-component system cell cycle response regulator CtrA
MRVLLVEGDVTAAQGLTRILQNAGFMVDHADMGEEALEMLRHYDYDLALLDLDLPDMDGSDLVRRMRHARNPVPALVLSTSTQPSVRIRAFAAGADDVVSKPFDQIELVARVQAILRRSKGYAAPVLQIANLRLNLDSREVMVDDRLVHLTGKEYSILELLVLRKGVVLTKDAFLNHLYGGMDEPEMKIIDVFICKLRKKLQLAGAGNLIGTIWGRGYMLRDDVAPVATPVPMPLPLQSKAILSAA